MFGVFTLLVLMIGPLPEIPITSFQKQLLLILYTILILIFMYFIFAGQYEYYTITQVKVFQNGFIPKKRLWRYVKDQKMMFIKWEEVNEVRDYVSSHSDECWRVIFKIPEKGTYSLRENDTNNSKKLREFLTELIDEKYPEAIHEEKFWM